jgi:hypothetical protein
MKKITFHHIYSANLAIILILLVHLFTLANMYQEATALGQSGFIRTSSSNTSSNNNNTNQTPFDDRCNIIHTIIPVECLKGDYFL